MVGPWLRFDSLTILPCFSPIFVLHESRKVALLPSSLGSSWSRVAVFPKFNPLGAHFGSSPLTARYCVLMESGHEGAVGKDSLSPRGGPGCGSRFYRHVSHLFGHEVLVVAAGWKGMEGRVPLRAQTLHQAAWV